MANIRTWLLEAVQNFGEPIEAIVVGKHDRCRSSVLSNEGVILSVDAGLAKLDQEYDNGYGSADCFPFYAWTASRVFFIAEYDGSTGLAWIPRNPIPTMSEFSGVIA